MKDPDLIMVPVFFYGTFMSADVLRASGLTRASTIVARLFGYQLCIRPRVNLVSCPDAVVYGAVANLAHQDIKHLYDGLERDFGLSYTPRPVMAHLPNKLFCPALCYMSDEFEDKAPDPVYIDELAACAKSLGASQAYLDHIYSHLN